MRALFQTYPKTIALLQVGTATLVAASSIWFGAWYPDAQAQLHDQIKKKDPNAEKPTFWVTSRSNLTWDSPVGYTFVFFLLAAVSSGGVIVNSLRLEDLEKQESKFRQEEEDHAQTQRYYYDLLKNNLVRLIAQQIAVFDDTCRVSVYRHDPHSAVFRMIFRHSRIQKYENKGRVTLPDNEGVLGATLLNGNHAYVSKLPKKQTKNYGKETNKQLANFGTKISDQTLGALNMPSRCYLGYAIRDTHTNAKFAILIFESTNENHFDVDVICNQLKQNSVEIEGQVRHISRLDAKLNPYGGA